jgi:hypothetical protein
MTANEDVVLTLAHDDALVLFDLLQRWIDDEGGECSRAHHGASGSELSKRCPGSQKQDYPNEQASGHEDAAAPVDSRGCDNPSNCRRSRRAFQLAPNHRGPAAGCALSRGMTQRLSSRAAPS